MIRASRGEQGSGLRPGEMNMNFANMGRNIVKVWMAYWDKFLITGLG